VQDFGGKLMEGDNLEDLVVDGRTILKRDLKDIGWKGVGRIHLAQNKGLLMLEMAMNRMSGISGLSGSYYFLKKVFALSSCLVS
jgi:hypothetical protein